MVISCILSYAFNNIIYQTAEGIHIVKKFNNFDSKGKERRGHLYNEYGNVVCGERCFLEHKRDFHVEILKGQRRDFESHGS